MTRRRPFLFAALSAGAVSVAALFGAAALSAAEPEFAGADLKRGAEIYAGVCAQCHDAGVERAPSRAVLAAMTPASIHAALTTGPMKPIGATLSDADRRSVAWFAAEQTRSAPASAAVKVCAPGTSPFDLRQPPELSGWGLAPGSTHAVPPAIAGIGRANAPLMRLKWAFAYPGATRARSQPAFAGGAIFVGSQDGTVFALDRETGCARWQFRAKAEVRTGIVVSSWVRGDPRARPAIHFGDLVGNAYAVDARTGRLLWSDKAGDHPAATLTGTPTLHAGRLYVPVSSRESAAARDPNYACCTFRGSVIAYEARTGKRLWQVFTVPPSAPVGTNAVGARRLAPSGAAIWSAPTIDARRGQLYVTTGNNYSAPPTATSDAVFAIDLVTGKVRWTRQVLSDPWNGSCFSREKINCPPQPGPDFDLGTGAVLTKGKDGRDYLLSGQKSGMLHALDPATGRIIWQRKLGRGGPRGGIHFGIAATEGTAYVPVADIGSDTEYVNYTEPGRPGVYAVDIATGALIWSAAAPDVCAGRTGCLVGYSAALTVTPELVLAGSTDGFLRVLDRATGKLVWQYDTVVPVRAVNGETARGGSIDGSAAPIVHRSLLVASSGYYAGVAQAPGNALLVFEAAQ